MMTMYFAVVLVLVVAYGLTYYVSDATCQRVCELTRSLSWGLALMVGVLTPLLCTIHLIESL